MLTPLAIARRSKGTPQWELAQLIGQPQSFLSLLEKGRRRPTPEQARQLADYFGIDVRDLFLNFKEEI